MINNKDKKMILTAIKTVQKLIKELSVKLLDPAKEILKKLSEMGMKPAKTSLEVISACAETTLNIPEPKAVLGIKTSSNPAPTC